ncbi:hypothetical protein OsJ_07070 [Oryza sativa Japonica Group]|uniref:Transposase, Ptta/En/Spm, plant n=1 Tax=Oryza sativa subsp. japonica TaxID=39947 RepID=B9F0G2_ORYSJ|nr:hypothetical protein OsJ_07070 [Oryza sativa Japonica Group]
MARTKRLNVVKISAKYKSGDGNISEHNPLHESQALEDDEIELEQQDDDSLNMSGESAKEDKRGRTTLTHIWNLPEGNHIVVKCNKLGQPIGAEGGLLGKFLGTVARNGSYCPFDLKDWRLVKKNGGAETILQLVETKFLYPQSCKQWILKSTGRDWRRFKASLKTAYFQPKKKRSALYKLCPEDIDYDQWVELVKFWKSKKGKALCEKNKSSRAMMKTTHTAGTKSYARWAKDMRQDDPQKKQPHRAMVYLATHKKRAEDRNEHLAELESLMDEQPELDEDDQGRVAWKGDALHQVLGEEKPGQVHGMGLLPVPNHVYGQTSHHLRNINITTVEGTPHEVAIHIIDDVEKLKEHAQKQDQLIQQLLKEKTDRKNKQEKVNRLKGYHSNSQLQAVHSKRKRVQCDAADREDLLSQQRYPFKDIYEDDDLSFSTEKYHNDANQEEPHYQEAPPSPWSAHSFRQEEMAKEGQKMFVKSTDNAHDQVIQSRVRSKKTRPSPMEVVD